MTEIVNQNLYSIITENSSSTSDDDAYLFQQFKDSTKKELVNSKTLSVDETWELHERQQQNLRDLEKANHNAKVGRLLDAQETRRY